MKNHLMLAFRKGYMTVSCAHNKTTVNLNWDINTKITTSCKTIFTCFTIILITFNTVCTKVWARDTFIWREINTKIWFTLKAIIPRGTASITIFLKTIFSNLIALDCSIWLILGLKAIMTLWAIVRRDTKLAIFDIAKKFLNTADTISIWIMISRLALKAEIKFTWKVTSYSWLSLIFSFFANSSIWFKIVSVITFSTIILKHTGTIIIYIACQVWIVNINVASS